MNRRRSLSLAILCLKPSANYLLFIMFLLLAAHCSLLIVAAQSSAATLSGTVTDQNGAVVPRANITMTNIATGAQRKATTNDEGDFIFVLLQPGSYKINTQRDGFAPVEVSNVNMNVGDQKALRIELTAGNISEIVKITADAPVINESPAVGTIVDRQFVANLPLNGRSFQSLITLSPGVVLAKTNSDNQGQFSVNGQRTSTNYFSVDGVSANLGSTASALPSQSAGGGIPALAATGGTNNLVSVDALQEFKIQTSTYAPEFGRSPGAQISIITRSGTNEFHGSAFDYFRKDALDANDWFANRSGLKRPPLTQNDFGGVFGGPVLLPRFGEGGSQPWYNGRNRTFFFFSYEGLRLRQPQVASDRSVPSMASRLSAPSALRPFLNAYPVPNGPETSNGLALFSASFANQIRLDSTGVRVDHALSKNFSLFGRYSYSPSRSNTRRPTLSNTNTLLSNTTTLTLGTTYMITPMIINDFRANYSTHNAASTSALDNFGGAIPIDDSFFFPAYTNRSESLVNFNAGTGGILFNGKSSNNFQKQINLIDTLSVIAESHQLKFGVDYRALYPTLGTTVYSIAFTFSGIAGPGGTAPSGTVLSGLMSRATVGHRSGNTYPQFANFSIFAQDTWKATRRLTLTYGLRWEVNPPPTEREGRDAFTVTGLENPATMTLVPQGTPLWKTTYNNFAPRIGAAYQLFQKQGWETVLRTGTGIFYDLGSGQAADGYGLYPYLITNFFPAGTPFPLTTAQLQPPDYNPGLRPISSIYAFGPDFKLPRTYHWNVSVDQSLGSNQTFTAAYVGAIGRKLLRQESILDPNPTFRTVFVINNSATSDYQSAQFQFQRRLSRGLQAVASYTWAKSLDTASDDATRLVPSRRIDPQIDHGPSDFDIRHAFNAAVTYGIPFPYKNPVAKTVLGHWSLDTIFSARSAAPVNVIVSRNIGFGTFNFRPDLVPGVGLYIDDPTVAGGRRFNNSVIAGSPNQRGPFLVSTAARQGTLGRNALRGFPLYQVDLGLRRQFNFTERLYLQIKAEAFNVLNRPNFADPLGTLGTFSTAGALTVDPGFGQSSQMFGKSLVGGLGGFSPLYQVGGARSVQLSLKLGF